MECCPNQQAYLLSTALFSVVLNLKLLCSSGIEVLTRQIMVVLSISPFAAIWLIFEPMVVKKS